MLHGSLDATETHRAETPIGNAPCGAGLNSFYSVRKGS